LTAAACASGAPVDLKAQGDDDLTPAAGDDYCADDSLGSGATARPTASGAYAFTTVLQECSLTAAEAATCYGATHESNISLSGGVRTISGNAIPNHDVDLFPNVGNPNVVSAQSISYQVTTSPEVGGEAQFARVIGVALNGIKMEPETAEVYSGGAWRYEALTFGGRVDGDTVNFSGTSLGLDCNFAHVQPTGEYHYHGVPTALMPASVGVTLVGWAADGFPILARYGYQTPGDESSAVVELRSSYRLKSGPRQALDTTDSPPPGDYDGTFVQDWEYDASLGDLDECNGRGEAVEIDGQSYDYAYYLTYSYPFMPRCIWGEIIDAAFSGAGGGGPPGGNLGPPPGQGPPPG